MKRNVKQGLAAVAGLGFASLSFGVHGKKVGATSKTSSNANANAWKRAQKNEA